MNISLEKKGGEGNSMGEQNRFTLSVTDAVLKLYDIGITEKSKILVMLMGTHPMLTLHTIDTIIRTHRKQQRNPKAEKPVKPKSPIELATKEILNKCAQCPFHFSGRPCVLPDGLCAFPEVIEMMKNRDELVAKQKRLNGSKKVRGGIIEYRRKENHHRSQNAFDILEDDLDMMIAEEELGREISQTPVYAPGIVMSRVMQDVQFVPEEKAQIGLDKSMKASLDDFSEVLSSNYRPDIDRDTFNFPIDEDQKNRLFNRYKGFYTDANGDIPAEELKESEVEKEFDELAETDVSMESANFDMDLSEDDALEQDALNHIKYLPRTKSIYDDFSSIDDKDWENIIAAAVERTALEGESEENFEDECNDNCLKDEILSSMELEDAIGEDFNYNRDDAALEDFADILAPGLLDR